MNFYLNKYSFLPPLISAQPQKMLGLIVVIPCFNEPNLESTLVALSKCEPTDNDVEVIVVINSGEHHSDELKAHNQKTYEIGLELAEKLNRKGLTFHFIHQPNLPKKHAGVGLARKIGMDEAVARFDQINKDGIIVCFDADATCETNYLKAIENHFQEHSETPGCAIHFEHPVDGDDYEQEVYEGIINYELHLRYYNQCLKYANLPYAYHTVGSSMAVRSSAYQKQGGMNKRKAGEDFYFIHKIIALGKFSELKNTKVIPSPRISDRVPFGTGKAIGDWITTGNTVYHTYQFKAFTIIRQFVHEVLEKEVKTIPDFLQEETSEIKAIFHEFLVQIQFEKALAEIDKNTKNKSAFTKRFFHWFDAFKVLKWVHFFRDNGYPNQPVVDETIHLLTANGYELPEKTPLSCLKYMRILEKM